jgi:transcriptional regulator with XRE-family HTH domain
MQLLGREVRVRRYQLSLTQLALALESDLSTTVVQTLEQGSAKNIELKSLHKIATALHTTVFDLFAGAANRGLADDEQGRVAAL